MEVNKVDKSEIYASRIQETISNVASCVAKITNMNSGVRKYGSLTPKSNMWRRGRKKRAYINFHTRMRSQFLMVGS